MYSDLDSEIPHSETEQCRLEEEELGPTLGNRKGGENNVRVWVGERKNLLVAESEVCMRFKRWL